MDFFDVVARTTKEGLIEIVPGFIVKRSKDLMVRGKAFYAIFDALTNLWSTDEYDVQRLVDDELLAYRNKHPEVTKTKLMGAFSSGVWKEFQAYIKNVSDSFHILDSQLTFANSEVKKEDYVSKRLPYSLIEGDHPAWDEIVSTLYNPDDRQKIEWAIGAIISGDSKTIQKALFLEGPPGSGKGTILNIFEMLFEGYLDHFEAKAVVNANNQFALQDFRGNSLVAIDHDADLSKITDNTRLNSLISHEKMSINEKGKPTYVMRFLAMLVVGSNKAVKFTDAKSGMIRRIIDAHPSGRTLAPKTYQALMSQVQFELGAIAQHCLEVYRGMGKNYYDRYVATGMMLQTNVFYNFIEDTYEEFAVEGGITLQRAFDLWNTWGEQTKIGFTIPRHRFRDELANYFKDYEDKKVVNGVEVKGWFSGFISEKFRPAAPEEHMVALVMDETESLFDKLFPDMPAQYSTPEGFPGKFWDKSPRQSKDGKEYIPSDDYVVSTTLAELDTTKEHYVKVPSNHIVIDFDLRDETGEKSAELNLAEASTWPPTYSEFSKGGGGIHLHYEWVGDTDELSRIYSDGIEVKVFTGNSSLRRRLSKCNNVPVAKLSSGLPLKEKKSMKNIEHVKTERGIRDMVLRCLQKEFGATKVNVDFIKKILDEAYESGVPYDLTDLRSRVIAFANTSTNQAQNALIVVTQMKWKSADTGDVVAAEANESLINSAFVKPKDDRLVIFDVEVFPNLFVICWKYEGDGNVVKMINPSPQEVEELMRLKLTGFNVRQYDNHILWGRYMGFNNEKLYQLSKKIIDGVPGARFGEAYDLSYADIYDYSSIKQGLKKFQIDLGLKHHELGLPWDQPVPDDMIEKVVEYCADDVISTEQVAENRKQDFIARQILAELSGLPVNATTLNHTAKIIFQGDRRAQEKFIYTNLSEEFPGYKFEGTKKTEKSSYMGEDPGEGGYVYAEPGMYQNVALLDIKSMHPTTIHVLNLFGPYTDNFWALVQARLGIKEGRLDEVKEMLGGKLAAYLGTEDEADDLAYALKIVVNIVYGLTSAKFDNPFRDKRNVDNIVAKRGALFMINLKREVQERGFKVIHIKTDSIKIADATPEIIEFVFEYGEKYGYEFDHEKTFEKIALVNDAVYIAKIGWAPPKKAKLIGTWDAVGAQFQHPYVFKTLFSKEAITFRDRCEAKFVKVGEMYLDFATHGDDDHDYKYVGRAGLFCPIPMEKGGAHLMVKREEGKYQAVTGTTGHQWLESYAVADAHKEKDIDDSYFRKLVDKALANIGQYGDVEQFIDA